MKWIAAIVAVAVMWLVGCARDDAAPVVRLPEVASSPDPTVSAQASEPAPAPSLPPSSSTTFEPWPNSCEARGLPVINPCPKRGVDVEIGGALSEPETLVFCCGSGPVGPYEAGESCFNALQAARACKDKKGEAAVQARMREAARVFGEWCSQQGFRDKYTAWPEYRPLCAERGYP